MCPCVLIDVSHCVWVYDCIYVSLKVCLCCSLYMCFCLSTYLSIKLGYICLVPMSFCTGAFSVNIFLCVIVSACDYTCLSVCCCILLAYTYIFVSVSVYVCLSLCQSVFGCEHKSVYVNISQCGCF